MALTKSLVGRRVGKKIAGPIPKKVRSEFVRTGGALRHAVRQVVAHIVHAQSEYKLALTWLRLGVMREGAVGGRLWQGAQANGCNT